MAIIDVIRKTDKKITANSHTVMDYNYNDEFFSMWSYKSGDLYGDYGTKQSLQFNKEIALELKNALEKFCNQ